MGKLAGLCKWARISRECFKQTQQDALFKNSEMKHFPFLPPPLHFLPGRKKKNKQNPCLWRWSWSNTSFGRCPKALKHPGTQVLRVRRARRGSAPLEMLVDAVGGGAKFVFKCQQMAWLKTKNQTSVLCFPRSRRILALAHRRNHARFLCKMGALPLLVLACYSLPVQHPAKYPDPFLGGAKTVPGTRSRTPPGFGCALRSCSSSGCAAAEVTA